MKTIRELFSSYLGGWVFTIAAVASLITGEIDRGLLFFALGWLHDIKRGQR